MKGTFPTQRHVPKKKIHKSSISQGEILGNTRKYWKILEKYKESIQGNTGKYWKILENTGKYWKMLENTGKVMGK